MKGRKVRGYKQVRTRNEAIDFGVHNFAALYWLGANVYDRLDNMDRKIGKGRRRKSRGETAGEVGAATQRAQLGNGVVVSSIESVQRLYEAVLPELDTKEFRPVKQRYWARKIGVVQQTVSTALNTLCRDGVFERGAPDGRDYRYRVNANHSRFVE